MKPKRLTVLLKPELYALTERLAQDLGKNVSELVRSLIAEKLREMGVFYDSSWLKMPQGARTDLATASAKAKFREKSRERLVRARAAKRERREAKAKRG